MDFLTWDSSFVAFGEGIRTALKMASSPSAVDKFNKVSLWSQLTGLKYSTIPDQSYNRAARELSRRFSYKLLQVSLWPIRNVEIVINVKKKQQQQKNKSIWTEINSF